MKFYRLVEKNDWGRVNYSINGQEYKFKRREIVKFPDGTERELTVVKVPYWETVSDHGIDETVYSEIPNVIVQVCGLNVTIPLSRLKVGRDESKIKKDNS